MIVQRWWLRFCWTGDYTKWRCQWRFFLEDDGRADCDAKESVTLHGKTDDMGTLVWNAKQKNFFDTEAAGHNARLIKIFYCYK